MTKGDTITVHTKDKIFLGCYERLNGENKKIQMFDLRNKEYIAIPYEDIINIYKSVLDVKSMIDIFQNVNIVQKDS